MIDKDQVFLVIGNGETHPDNNKIDQGVPIGNFVKFKSIGNINGFYFFYDLLTSKQHLLGKESIDKTLIPISIP